MTSIEAFDPRSPSARVDSPTSQEAMRRLGLELSDLLFLPKEEFANKLINTERLDQRYATYEQKRMQRIEDVKALRKKLGSPRASPVQKSVSSARNSVSPQTPSSRLKPLEEREKHYLDLLRAKREEHLRQIAKAERYNQLHLAHRLLSTQAQTERERRRQREEYEKSREQAALRQEHRAFLAESHRTHQDLAFLQAKKQQLQAQLAALKSVGSTDSIRREAAEQLQELAEKVERQRQRLLTAKSIRTESKIKLRDPEALHKVQTAKDNLSQLLQLSSDASAVRLSRHSQHITILETKKELEKRLKEQQRQEKEVRMMHYTETRTQELIQKKDSIALKDDTIKERVTNVKKLRESRIKTNAEKERARQAHSELSRHQREEMLRSRLMEVSSELREVERKAEKSIKHREESNKRRKEMNALHRTDTQKNIQRIRKADTYLKEVALARIQEERTSRLLQQEAKHTQARQKQMLHKQLLSERHRMVHDFDRLLSKKGPTFLFDEHVSEILNKSAESITLPRITPRKSPISLRVEDGSNTIV